MTDSILIAVPAYGEIMNSRTALGLWKTGRQFDALGIKHDLLTVGNQSLISLGRSDIANWFINCTEHDWIMWIDADIVFDPNDILRLKQLQVPFSSAAYSMK